MRHLISEFWPLAAVVAGMAAVFCTGRWTGSHNPAPRLLDAEYRRGRAEQRAYVAANIAAGMVLVDGPEGPTWADQCGRCGPPRYNTTVYPPLDPAVLEAEAAADGLPGAAPPPGWAGLMPAGLLDFTAMTPLERDQITSWELSRRQDRRLEAWQASCRLGMDQAAEHGRQLAMAEA